MNFALSLAAAAAISGASIYAWHLLLTCLSVLQNPQQDAGWLSKALIRQGRPTPLALAGILIVFSLKLGIVALALYFVLKASWCSLPGLLIGLGLPALGLSIARLLGAHRKPQD